MRVLLVGLALLVAIQFIPVDRTNPPVESPVPAPAAVESILRRACYDCHSNETAWPWYSRVAPGSWLIARDVAQGRRHLNFSEWNRLTPVERVRSLEEAWEEIESGEMPLAIYTPLHPEAHLSDADKAALEAWIKEATQ